MQPTLFNPTSLPAPAGALAKQSRKPRESELCSICHTHCLSGAVDINPYKGCGVGCIYCAVHDTAPEPSGGTRAFSEEVFVRETADRALLLALDRDLIGQRPIAIGTTTDPYQPAEVRFGLTRRILEVFRYTPGYRIELTTKSALVARDVALLGQLARRHDLRVWMSLSTMDSEVVGAMEPGASGPEERLEAMSRLSAEGVLTGVLMAPVIPSLNDSMEEMERVVAAASSVGARFVGFDVLSLGPTVREAFFRFVHQFYPHLEPRLRHLFEGRVSPPPIFRQAVATRMRTLREKYGLGPRLQRSYASNRRGISREPGGSSTGQSWGSAETSR